MGIYCNGFWGCGALDPHKCNQSELIHSIKEVEIVKGNISTGRSSHRPYPAYLIGKCIDQERREGSGYFVRRGSEEKREKDYKECVVGTL